jgi:hypothetical protein
MLKERFIWDEHITGMVIRVEECEI